MKKMIGLLACLVLSMASVAQEDDSLYFIAYNLQDDEISLFKLDGTVVNFELDASFDTVFLSYRLRDDGFFTSLYNNESREVAEYFVSPESGLRRFDSDYPIPEGYQLYLADISLLHFPYYLSVVKYDDDAIYNTVPRSRLVLFNIETSESEVLSDYPDGGPGDCCYISEDGQSLIYVRAEAAHVGTVNYALVERELATGTERSIYETAASYPAELPEEVDYREIVQFRSNDDGSQWLASVVHEDSVDFSLVNLDSEILWEESFARIDGCEPFVFLSNNELWRYNSYEALGSGEGCDESFLIRYQDINSEGASYSMDGVVTFANGFPVYPVSESQILIYDTAFYVLSEGEAPRHIGDTSRALSSSDRNGVSPDNRYVFIAEDVESTEFQMVEIATGEVVWEGEGATLSPIHFDTPRYWRMLRMNYTFNFSEMRAEDVSVGAFIRDNETGEVYELPTLEGENHYYGEVFPNGTMLRLRDGDIYLYTLETGEESLIAEDIGAFGEVRDFR